VRESFIGGLAYSTFRGMEIIPFGYVLIGGDDIHSGTMDESPVFESHVHMFAFSQTCKHP
jgi:hypothetical protein